MLTLGTSSHLRHRLRKTVMRREGLEADGSIAWWLVVTSIRELSTALRGIASGQPVQTSTYVYILLGRPIRERGFTVLDADLK